MTHPRVPCTSRVPNRHQTGNVGAQLQRIQNRLNSAQRAAPALDQVGPELTQDLSTIGGPEQRILVGQFGHVLNLAAYAHQFCSADCFLNQPIEVVPFIVWAAASASHVSYLALVTVCGPPFRRPSASFLNTYRVVEGVRQILQKLRL